MASLAFCDGVWSSWANPMRQAKLTRPIPPSQIIFQTLLITALLFGRLGFLFGDLFTLRVVEKTKGGRYTGGFKNDLISSDRRILKTDTFYVNQPVQLANFVEEADDTLEIALYGDVHRNLSIKFLIVLCA